MQTETVNSVVNVVLIHWMCAVHEDSVQRLLTGAQWPQWIQLALVEWSAVCDWRSTGCWCNASASHAVLAARLPNSVRSRQFCLCYWSYDFVPQTGIFFRFFRWNLYEKKDCVTYGKCTKFAKCFHFTQFFDMLIFFMDISSLQIVLC